MSVGSSGIGNFGLTVAPGTSTPVCLHEPNQIVLAIHHPLVLGVQEVHVIKLREVIDHRLPIASNVHRLILNKRHLRKLIAESNQ